jgi:hypothetical protein
MRCCLAIVLLLVGLVSQPAAQEALSVDNVSKYLGNEQWEWTIFVKAPASVVKDVQAVEYRLHPTFSPSVVTVTEPGSQEMPFGLRRTGWGVFEVAVKVTFRDGRTTRLTHMLKFVPPDTPCLSDLVVAQEQFRLLQDRRFNNDLYVYVGDVKKIPYGVANHGFRVTSARVVVFIGNQQTWGSGSALKEKAFDARLVAAPVSKWELAARREGDTLQVDYGGKPWVLSVVKLMAGGTLGSGDRLSLRLCEK